MKKLTLTLAIAALLGAATVSYADQTTDTSTAPSSDQTAAPAPSSSMPTNAAPSGEMTK